MKKTEERSPDLQRFPGLNKLVSAPEYRTALNLPESMTETYEAFAQGEYNSNFRFIHPVNQNELLLRVNCGSQMHLEDQIGYEANALKLLESSGRTPKLYYVDGSRRYLDHGVLVEELLPGTALNYETDLMKAAEILADVHSTPVPDSHGLLSFPDSSAAVLEECESMAKVFFESSSADPLKKERIRELLDFAWKLQKEFTESGRMEVPEDGMAIINTELNNTNFLIGEGTGYLIDWEKPLYGDPAQDLGHFLAPTTTFWKTDAIFTKEQTEEFLDLYLEAVGKRKNTKGLRERTRMFVRLTCLRGITWCAMAKTEYEKPGRELVNESTAKKLDAYLSDEFLDRIEQFVKKEKKEI